MSGQKKGWNNWLLLFGVLVLAVMPLFLARGSEFSGADGKAESAISEVQPGYKSWFAPLWEPPGAEIESLLFALQAAMGAGTMGFVVGLYRGRAEHKSKLPISHRNDHSN